MTKKSVRGYDEDWDEGQDEDLYIPLYVPEKYRHLNATEDRITVRQLWDRYCNADLILQPDFQRNYVWDNSKASRYIESLLLRLPTPPIFLSEEPDGKWIVIDGHQRLESLFRYMQPLLSGPRKYAHVPLPFGPLIPLTLAGVEVLSELNGGGITSLTMEDRDKLWNTMLSVIQIPKSAHSDMKYVLFSRLNQGSMSLNSQELRNCLYRGLYNQLIARISESHDFLALWGRATPDRRMRHRELVLRFYAFLHRRDKYRIPFRAFLNDEMESGCSLQQDDAERYQRQFGTAVLWAEIIFGNEVFRQFLMGKESNTAGQWGRRRYDLVYEVEMVGFAQFADSLDTFWAKASPQERQILRLVMRNRLATAMTSERFIDSINQGTTRVSAVNARFEAWLGALRSITQDFSGAIREGQLIEKALSRSDVCGECPYPISSDDAAWIEIDGKQKLVHRYCKLRRQ